MCSNAIPSAQAGGDPPADAGGDLAGRLGAAIDELAAAASDSASSELADRVARAWAVIIGADPELAARMRRYWR